MTEKEYIERGELIDILEARAQMLIGTPVQVYYSAASIVKKLPAADAVEVVRCKDCVYWQDNNGGYPQKECRWGKGETPDLNDFCSYGTFFAFTEKGKARNEREEI